jgi:hypothetical protein
MTHKIQIKQYPKLIEEFSRENFNLKTLAGALIGLMLVNSLVLAFLLKRGPMVIPLQADGAIARVDSQVTDAQIVTAIRAYLETRYTWTDATITTQLKRAEAFVAPSSVPSFQKSMVETIKYVRQKKVSQRIYPRMNGSHPAIEINFKDRVVTVTADRITEFDGLKAATDMQLSLNFDLFDRTADNPWGVYVTKETEKAAQ